MMNAPAARYFEGHLPANPSSPLFARMAEKLLKNGEVSSAERLCEEGLSFHPGYTTGRLMYARCLAARGEYGKALVSIEEVAARYPGNILLAELIDEWRGLLAGEPAAATADLAVFTELPDVLPLRTEIAREQTAPPSAGAAGPDDTIARTVEIGLPPAQPVETPSPAPSVLLPGNGPPPRAETPVPPQSDFREPDERGGLPPMPVPSRGVAPVPILPPVPRTWKGPGFIEGGRIVSRTLAEIYASQGAVGEAVETYRILLGRMPGMREELEPRLKQLEERLRTDHGGPRPAPGNAKAPA